MKTKILLAGLSALLLLNRTIVEAQTNTFPSTGNAGIGTTSPLASAALEIKSTSKGLLIPRMTQAQRNAVLVSTTATALLIYQTDNTPGFYFYTGTAWAPISAINANTKLSNLAAPTAINQDLLPNSNNTRNLGSAPNSWKTLYIDNNIYVKDSLFLNAKGTQNTFVGQRAGYDVSTGANNAAYGYHALYSNATGDYSSAFGSYALESSTASDNTAFGYRALNLSTLGTANTATGKVAMYKNTTGSYNTATGHNALYSNTKGSSNTANGAFALYSNSTGNSNIAIGDSALYSNTAGFNVAVGNKALFGNTTGTYNTALGYNATANTPDYNATAIGSNAYADCINCMVLGSVNGINGAASDVSIGIGTNNPGSNNSLEIQSALGTAIYSASNRAGGTGVYAQCNNGNSSDYGVWGLSGSGYAGVFSGNVTYTGTLTGPSDEKLKENIRLTDNMLGKVMQLKPSQYNFKAEYKKMNLPKGNQIGFVAQDLEKIFPQLVMNAYDKLVDSGKVFEYKSVNYIGLIPILTKAIQELSKKNDSLKTVYDTKFDAQQKEIDELRAMIVSSSKTALVSSASLAQNIPNPFTNSTSISYNLPQQYASAKLIITDKKGAVLKETSLTASGKGSLNVDASTLAAGAYQYSLYINNKLIDTKQMLLSR